jgi:hypothetical protein
MLLMGRKDNLNGLRQKLTVGQLRLINKTEAITSKVKE